MKEDFDSLAKHVTELASQLQEVSRVLDKPPTVIYAYVAELRDFLDSWLTGKEITK